VIDDVELVEQLGDQRGTTEAFPVCGREQIHPNRMLFVAMATVTLGMMFSFQWLMWNEGLVPI
jgi:hypothetical protein